MFVNHRIPSQLLFDRDDVLVFRMDLAVVLGCFRQAIVLQKVHHLCDENRRFNTDDSYYVDDQWWCCVAWSEWEEIFRCWSPRTIRRLFSRLIDKGFIILRPAQDELNHTGNWFTVDYDKLNQLVGDEE